MFFDPTIALYAFACTLMTLGTLGLFILSLLLVLVAYVQTRERGRNR